MNTAEVTDQRWDRTGSEKVLAEAWPWEKGLREHEMEPNTVEGECEGPGRLTFSQGGFGHKHLLNALQQQLQIFL